MSTSKCTFCGEGGVIYVFRLYDHLEGLDTINFCSRECSVLWMSGKWDEAESWHKNHIEDCSAKYWKNWDISLRSKHVLTMAYGNIACPHKIDAMMDSELLKLKNFGRKSLKEIREAIERYKKDPSSVLI